MGNAELLPAASIAAHRGHGREPPGAHPTLSLLDRDCPHVFMGRPKSLYTSPYTCMYVAYSIPLCGFFALASSPPADRLRKTAIARQCHVNGKLPRWGASAAKRQVVRRRRPYCSLGHSAQTRFVPRSALSCIALQWRPWTWKIPSSIAPRFIPRLAALYDARFSVLKAMI